MSSWPPELTAYCRRKETSRSRRRKPWSWHLAHRQQETQQETGLRAVVTGGSVVMFPVGSFEIQPGLHQHTAGERDGEIQDNEQDQIYQGAPKCPACSPRTACKNKSDCHAKRQRHDHAEKAYPHLIVAGKKQLAEGCESEAHSTRNHSQQDARQAIGPLRRARGRLAGCCDGRFRCHVAGEEDRRVC